MTFRPRWQAQKSLAPYAHLPGSTPHPVRTPCGHSFENKIELISAMVSPSSDIFVWGVDLFNYGYYWEAHEAWEGLWRVEPHDSSLRMLLKALILLSAAGLKIREGKNRAAIHHAQHAAELLRELAEAPDEAFEHSLGISFSALFTYAAAVGKMPIDLEPATGEQTLVVFDFILGHSQSRIHSHES